MLKNNYICSLKTRGKVQDETNDRMSCSMSKPCINQDLFMYELKILNRKFEHRRKHIRD